MDEADRQSDASSGGGGGGRHSSADASDGASSAGGGGDRSTVDSECGGAGGDELEPQEVVRQCEAEFTAPDCIMEPTVVSTLLRYTTAGGDPDAAINCLADNYAAMAQICNLLGEWLLPFESTSEAVQELYEGTVCELAVQHFQPNIADRLLSQASDADMAWLPELIQRQRWRRMIYSLTELHPDCMMLNFAIKLCSEAGHQHEISNVHTAAQQLEIFSAVLVAGVKSALCQQHLGARSSAFDAAVRDLARVAGHTEATYLYAQALLRFAAQKEAATPNGVAPALAFLAQELRTAVGHDTTDTTLAVLNTPGTGADTPDARTDAAVYPQALLSAMQSMLHKATLNPADASLLHDAYMAPSHGQSAPPAELVREPAFVRLLVDSLFTPRPTVKLTADRRHIYARLLAYASAAWPRTLTAGGGGGGAARWNGDDVPKTEAAVCAMSDLCQGRRHGGTSGETFASELLADLPDVLAAIAAEPAVAYGMVHFVRCTVDEPTYFHLHPDAVPVHFALLDEVASSHPLMHAMVLDLLSGQLDRLATNADGAVAERLIERQRMLIDRLVHLLSVGCALAVTELMSGRYEAKAIDTSLIRYFTMEVLDIISPPYSDEFSAVFLPLVASDEIVERRTVGERAAAQAADFVQACGAKGLVAAREAA